MCIDANKARGSVSASALEIEPPPASAFSFYSLANFFQKIESYYLQFLIPFFYLKFSLFPFMTS